MNALELVRLLRERRQLAARDLWTPRRLGEHQARALGQLRSHAYERSPFYRDFHAGYERAPLDELPVLTKAMLMERFDDLATDRMVKLADVLSYLATASATDRFLGRYRVAATGGTTGRRGIFLADPSEWNTILASYSRAYAWAGVPVGPAHPLRMAIVSSTVPTHQSSIVGATVRNPLVPTLRLNASDPLAQTVAALNEFRPQALVGYASILGELAGEQLAGRLRIAPRAVFSASEVLTPQVRAAASDAWGAAPYNVYAATETAGIASECQRREMHVYSDLVIIESVDEANRPVPAGTTGAKLLATVLFSRTQPLIRYELTDRVRLSDAPATHLGPFGLLVTAIEGRTEDLLTVPGIDGGDVRVHPNVFHGVLEPVNAPWQVVRKPDSIVVLVAGPVSVTELERDVAAALRGAGAAPLAVSVSQVPAIPRTALGKAPLVRVETTS